MKKVLPTTLTAAAIIGACCTTSAQPTITLADITPSYGSQIVNYSSDFLDINEEGSNLTWDFSSLSSEESEVMHIVSPTGQPGTDLFPDATHVILVNLDEGDVFTYQKYADGAVSAMGIYTEIELVLVQIYTDPKTMFELPMTFGNSSTDTYHSEADLGSGLVMVQDGQFTSTVTGYGTVITPMGVYENVLQVKMSDASTSRMFLNGTVLNEDSVTTEDYSYITAGIPFPLIGMSTSFDDDGNPEWQGGSYNDFTSGLTTDLSASIELGVFPNPAVHDVTLDFRLNKSGEVEIDLLSVDGRSIAQLMDRKSLPSGKISIRKNLPDLAAGTYLIRISTPDGIVTRKLILTDR